MGRVEGRVAFITGGARGQGRAMAEKLAQEGADIVIVDICAQISTVPYEMATVDDLQDTRRAVEALDRRCIAEVADVRNEARLREVAAQAMDEFGRIDILCANAGIVNFSPWDEMTQQQWDDMLAVNLTGVWHSIRAIAPHMRDGGGGSMILTSSVNGLEAGGDMAHYVAAKTGVLGLMREFAYVLGPLNIRVNAVLPGTINSKMGDNPATRAWIFKRPDATTEDYLQATRNWAVLRGRYSMPPRVIADAVIWLASDESRHVTGLELVVDAGHMVLPGFNHNPIVDDPIEL